MSLPDLLLEDAERRLLAAGERDDPHPDPLSEGDETREDPSGLSRSITVVIGQPFAATQAPARSQLPACGSATTAPRPAATSAASISSPSSRNPASTASRDSDGRRNISTQ
ncbi:hypothetical protein Prubr_48420 [Polymorphospora rubra]|uniref:Uncharacterized protein n=1 Tax=Polymorphospora rubra TaxID=338584 RepID=A0A810N2E6_9ACTN|nr:hypothetical protein Prubr_48420 [Polymorphospora rubra]